jgi:hypothetical protein
MEVIFNKLQLKPRTVSEKSLQVRFIEQIIYFLLVNLEVRTVNCKFLFTERAFFLGEVKE